MPNDETEQPQRPIIGWREWVSLPDLGNVTIKAKIDTGARSSAIYAENIRVFQDHNRDMVAFQIFPNQGSTDMVVDCVAPLVDTRAVRNSGGTADHRHFISTGVRLGDSTITIELSLADRSDMGFRMLLGREAIRGRYLIEPGRSYLTGPRPPSKENALTADEPADDSAGDDDDI